jgi:23S rRNA (guanosine2251-2'-O)-methyltransferase
MKNVYIVLENIRSAWNVGSIMRTCDAVGYKIIFVGYTPRPKNHTLALISKTAIGAQNTVPWEEFENSQDVFSKYQQDTNLHIAIEISDTSQNIFDFFDDNTQQNYKNTVTNTTTNIENLFLWFGNEIHGVTPSTQESCFKSIHLPMVGMKESLNVCSCMTAISYLFYYKNLNLLK